MQLFFYFGAVSLRITADQHILLLIADTISLSQDPRVGILSSIGAPLLCMWAPNPNKLLCLYYDGRYLILACGLDISRLFDFSQADLINWLDF